MDAGADRRKLAMVFGVILAMWGAWSIASAIIAVNTTGVLDVTASRSAAVISIGQADRTAAIIGTGSARVRLAPGTYQLVATYKGSRTASIVKVSKKHRSRAYLDLAKTSILPSPAAINFQNMYFLIAQGITQAQATQLQEEFFQFKPRAHTVAIDASSVQSGTRDPGPDVPFSLTFNVAVDGTTYKADATYSDFDSIRLRLSPPGSSKVIFDSNAVDQADRR